MPTNKPATVIDPFHRIVWPLAVAETLIWAAIYYVFPALLLEWERDLGWTKTELSGAFTSALIVSALMAPIVGRLIDRGNSLISFTGSAIFAACLLILLSFVQAQWQFYVIWILLGVAMSGSLYEACFSVLTHTMGNRSRQSITIVTLVAGFAGTLSFPGNHYLVGLMGWRSTMWVLAGIILFIVVPLIWLGTQTALAYRADNKKDVVQPSGEPEAKHSVSLVRNGTFWLLAIGFAAVALDHGMLLTHLLPLLDERGITSGQAVFAASMIGPMQVTGRLMMLAFEKRVSSIGIFAACYIALGLAAISLLGATYLPLLLISFVFFQGAGAGVTSIMRPVVVAELLGRQNFGLIAGFLAMPFLIGAALAPTIAAIIWGFGGYDLVIWFAVGASIIGLAALLGAATLSEQAKTS
ncbi:MAG: MFS transporter [Chloroflexota bacterium]